MPDAAYWIHKLALSPHPEGGYYRRMYMSQLQVNQNTLPEGYQGARPLMTAIYYLLPGSEFSALHRLQSDELWHFYSGVSLTLHAIDEDDHYHEIKLGSDIEAGHVFQAVIPAGWWFGATVDDAKGFALLGCCVSPGFDFADFELGNRHELLQRYPVHGELIKRLTR
jgi:predicted cupin superfamily sugar epimerase